MNKLRKVFFKPLLLVLMSTFASVESARALDLTGAWASDRDQCSKVFAHKNGQIVFRKDSDIYGSGFIVRGNQIAGRAARCTIKARKDNGMSVNLIAACASDIMLQSVQFNLQKVDADTLVRLFPGMEGMEIKYFRCSLQ